MVRIRVESDGTPNNFSLWFDFLEENISTCIAGLKKKDLNNLKRAIEKEEKFLLGGRKNES